MTKADKTEILNLISNVKEIAKVAQEANAGYHDKGVTSYANDAIRDAEEVRDFVKKVIQDNIIHFIDPSCIHIGGGVWGYNEISYFKRTQNIHINVGECLFATIHVDSWEERKDMRRTMDDMYISAHKDDITVEDIYIQTSNTDLKFNDWEYKDCRIYTLSSTNDLFYKNTGKYYFSSANYNSQGWEFIRTMAEMTRKKTAFIIYSIKKKLTAIANGLHNLANERILARERNEKVGVYIKVSL